MTSDSPALTLGDLIDAYIAHREGEGCPTCDGIGYLLAFSTTSHYYRSYLGHKQSCPLCKNLPVLTTGCQLGEKILNQYFVETP